MAATLRVIWLCACVRYWPHRWLVLSVSLAVINSYSITQVMRIYQMNSTGKLPLSVAILPSIIVRNVRRHIRRKKIYVGHEALRATMQFKEKRRKVELKPEQVRIPEITIRASERSSTDMRSIKLQSRFLIILPVILSEVRHWHI